MMKNNNDFDILNLKTELSFRGYSEATKKLYVQTVTNFLNEVNNVLRPIRRQIPSMHDPRLKPDDRG